MEDKVLKEVLTRIDKEEGVALVTITKSIGSTPRKSGAVMGIWDNGTIGTIGGGKIENAVINLARNLIYKGESESFSYGLNPNGELGMTCGGEVEGFIKVFPAKPKVIIVGAGHIGQALLRVCNSIEFNSIILDDREEYLNGIDNAILGNMAESLENINIHSNTYIVLTTRGHALDRECLKKVINSKAKYIGMVGSRRKVIDMRAALIDDGFDEEKLKAVYSPVGLKISDGSPNEMAIEILAEILKVKNNGELVHRILK